MSPLGAAPGFALGTLPSTQGSDRARLAAAARQFEAIFVRQMLAAARKSDLGGDSLLGGPALETFRTMQDEQFADQAAQHGSFGLARVIEAALAAQVQGTSTRPEGT